MQRIIILLIVIVAFCVGCKNNPGSPVTEAKEIWPLKIGNFWITKTTQYDSLGQFIQSHIDTMIVPRIDTIIDNENIYLLYANINIDNFFDSIAVLNRNDGFYFVLTSEVYPQNFYVYSMCFKYPGNVGQTSLDTTKILSIDTIIHSMNTSFNCYNYSFENQFDEPWAKKSYFLSPGIGPIYFETHSRLADGSFYLSSKTELLNYWVQ